MNVLMPEPIGRDGSISANGAYRRSVSNSAQRIWDFAPPLAPNGH